MTFEHPYRETMNADLLADGSLKLTIYERIFNLPPEYVEQLRQVLEQNEISNCKELRKRVAKLKSGDLVYSQWESAAAGEYQIKGQVYSYNRELYQFPGVLLRHYNDDIPPNLIRVTVT